MAYPIRILGYPAGSVEFLEEGESLAQDLRDPKALANFQSIIGMYYLMSGGDPLKGREYVERGLEGSELTEEVDTIVPATMDLISSYMIEGRFSRVCQVALKLIDLIEKTQTEHDLFLGRTSNMYSVLNGYCGASLGATGRFVEGERLLEKGLSFARDIHNLYSIAMIEMFYGVYYWFKGNAENQVKHWRSAIESLEKSEMSIFQGPAYGPGWARDIFIRARPTRLCNVRKRVLKCTRISVYPFSWDSFTGSLVRFIWTQAILKRP